jgi:transposase
MRQKKREVLLDDAQWKVLASLFPEPRRRKDGRGRPWASNRSCLEGILWVLRTDARWRGLPEKYPDGSICWRRLRMWEEEGIWLAAWQKRLSMLDQRRLLDWEEVFPR